MKIKYPAKIVYLYAKIRDWDDTINYPNIYLDNLYKDLNINLNNYEIHLGLINDNTDDDIKKEIKQKYPFFQINDIDKFVEKSNYSHFCQCFSTKIKVKNNSQLYSHGIFENKFTYITKTKLNEISNIIANDHKVKQWIDHIKDWNRNLPRKIEQLKTYDNDQKWRVKNCEKEIIKGYIRDWTYVSTLIEHELKLDELNKAFLPLCTIFKFYHINFEKSLFTDFSPHF